MRNLDYHSIIKEAWQVYGSKKAITNIADISAMVSTNHVYRITLEGNRHVIAKLSYFGKYEHFKEDHQIIQVLSNNLLYPYENLVAKSLVKNNEVFTYRYKKNMLDAWVVFYNPIRVENKLPPRLEEKHILNMGNQLAHFHVACADVSSELPESSKTLEVDVFQLLDYIKTEQGKFELRGYIDEIKLQCDTFLESLVKLKYESFEKIPVFIDWNIGNFSVNDKDEFYSRWDYDWFRMSSRVMDFYFFSRVVSNVGDKTVFSYVGSTLMEDRFMMFLKEYHKVSPLSENEVHFIKEAYRFFILTYVINHGRFFFHEMYANKFLSEAFTLYFPQLKEIDTFKILKHLDI